MTEPIKVSVDRINFDNACSNDYIDGKIRALVTGSGMQEAWVYVELGIEKKYRRHRKDDPKTEYKLFINCTVCVAYTEEDLENGDWSTTMSGLTVLISCSEV